MNFNIQISGWIEFSRPRNQNVEISDISRWLWISSLEYKHEEDEQKEMKTEYAEEEEQDIPY